VLIEDTFYSLGTQMLPNLYIYLRGHIKAPKWHLKGLLATSKWHALLVYSGCCHGKM